MESIRRDSVSSDSGDEFFDCQGWFPIFLLYLALLIIIMVQIISIICNLAENMSESSSVLQKWSSLELILNDGDEENVGMSDNAKTFSDGHYRETYTPSSLTNSPTHQASPCATSILIIIVHAGSVLDSYAGTNFIVNRLINLNNYAENLN